MKGVSEKREMLYIYIKTIDTFDYDNNKVH